MKLAQILSKALAFSIVYICIGTTLSHAKKSTKPNVIFILCDDLGYADLGVTGSKLNRTPNIDRMAEQGIRLTDCYSVGCVCSPSRAGLLTGQYAPRTGVSAVLHPWSQSGIDSTDITIASILQDAGYYSGLIGKWHLGHQQANLPLQNGFQEFFGMPYSNNMSPCVYYRGNEVETETVDQTQTTKTYTQEAIRFLKENKNRPFFLYLAHNMPHTPLFASEQFKGKSNNGLYGDVIEELDWSVGEVLKTLKKLKLEENTLVIFSSDNGPWLTMGPHAGSALPFFHGKSSNWEGGHRTPTIAYWKGKIKPKVYTGVTSLLDWFPTITSLSGAAMPTDRIIDGQNLSEVLFTKEGTRENEEFFYFYVNAIRAYRSGDYKLVLPEKLKKGNRFVADVPAHDTLLFNIRKDMAEVINLKSIMPEKVKEMISNLEAFKTTMKGLRPNPVGRKTKGYKGLPIGVPRERH